MLNFGDIFRFKDRIYVHLAAKDDGVTRYAAKVISDPDNINELLCRKNSIRGINVGPQKKNISEYLSCFIELTTAPFQECLAFLADSDKHGVTDDCEKLGNLNNDDVEELKKGILENQNVLPPIVINYVKELNGVK